MSWDSELVTMLRYYIDDLSDTPTYSDDRLQVLLLVATQRLQAEVEFDTFYTISIDNVTLKPDPTVVPNRNDAFIWLVLLLACIILFQSEMKTSGGQAISIRDGSSAIDLREVAVQKKKLLDSVLKQYEDAKWRYQLGERPAGVGILGPFSIITNAIYGQQGGFYQNLPRDRPYFP